jgi:hypothetical protein
MSKFGSIVERLVGASVFFVPDGEDFSLTETPDLASVTNKPATTEWNAFSLGRVNMAKYTPKTKDRTREWAVPTGGYKERTDTVVVEDAFEFTMIDYAAKLFDQLMFGMATAPVSGTSQQAFAESTRRKDGWLRMVRYDEDGNAFCELEIHSRLTIAQVPEDKNEPGSPVLRVGHLADGGVLDIIELTYPA